MVDPAEKLRSFADHGGDGDGLLNGIGLGIRVAAVVFGHLR